RASLPSTPLFRALRGHRHLVVGPERTRVDQDKSNRRVIHSLQYMKHAAFTMLQQQVAAHVLKAQDPRGKLDDIVFAHLDLAKAGAAQAHGPPFLSRLPLPQAVFALARANSAGS